MAIDWTFRPRSEIGGLAAITAGDHAAHRPLVVLLHGVGLRAESWSPVIDALSHHFEVIALDLPGHGESPGLAAQDCSLSDFTDAIMNAISKPAVLIGHSMGAMITLDAGTRFPERIKAVIALNAIFERTPEARSAVMQRLATLCDTAPGVARMGDRISDPEPTLIRWFGTQPSPERAACARWLMSNDLKNYRAAYGVFAHHDGPSRARLQQMRSPALFITGGRDPNSTPAMSRALAALAPDGEAVVIEDAAHMLPMTHSQQMLQQLQIFLDDALSMERAP